MRRITGITAAVIVLLLVLSCTNDIASPLDSNEKSWEGIFRLYWNAMNSEYVHFERETVDWDRVYEKYLPLFEELDFTRQEDSLSAFRYFREIALALNGDGHYALTVYDDFGSSIRVICASERKWLERGESGDDEDYPDVVWTERGTSSYRGVNGKVTIADLDNPTDAERDAYWAYLDSVEGNSEVRVLLNSGTDEDGEYGCFHNGTEDFTDFVGWTIKADDETITDSEARKLWKEIVTYLKLDRFSGFYGITEDGIFYFHFTSFPSMEAVYAASLADEEEPVFLSAELEEFRERLRSGDDPLCSKLLPQLSSLKRISDMLINLGLIGNGDGCTFDDGETFRSVRGVIMDVRCNSGGVLEFEHTLMCRFFAEDTLLGYLRYKGGYSRYEYTPWFEYKIEAGIYERYENYPHPFYVIVNGASISCSENAARTASFLPKGKIIGSTTYGALSPLHEREIMHSGPLETEYLEIYTTSFIMTGLDKENFEYRGIDPDIYVESGTDCDRRYIRALEEIRKDIAAEST